MAVLSTEELQALAKIAGPQYSVPVNLLVAVALHESSGDPLARGSAGEYGLMQLMPGTADMLGFKGDYDLLLHSPLLNMRLGAKYLGQQFKRYGNWRQALSAYNAGTATASNEQGYALPILRMANALPPVALGIDLAAIALVGLAAWAVGRR